MRAGVRLTPRAAEIFDLILRYPGISSLRLAEIFTGNTDRGSQSTVRQHITKLNSLLVSTDVHIEGRRSYGYAIKGLPNAAPLRTDARRPQVKAQPRA